MKGHTEIIEILNEVLTGELTAINQYFLHASMCKNWGYNQLFSKIHAESIDEMKHARSLTDRILFLDGLPNMQKLGKLHIGENVQQILEADLQLEEEAIPRLKRGISLCLTHHDVGTRELFEHILVEEEAHVDWLEAQLTLISQIGYQNYLSQQIHG